VLRERLFWGSGALLAWPYLGFPALVLLRGALRRRPFTIAEHTPSVAVVVAAHNEAQTIEAKLDNLMSLEYPSDRLQVVIASDGSTDGTDDAVRRRSGDGFKLLSFARSGKAAVLNAAVAAISADVLVFTDANSVLRPNAVHALVRPLADPEVGVVAGDQRYTRDGDAEGTAVGERDYWSFDRALKRAQSASGSIVGATGALYAVRRELFEPIPDGLTDDFYVSLAAVARGARLVFEPEAVAYEAAAPSAAREFRRRARVLTRGLRCVVVMRRLLNPRRYGFFAVQLLSQKLLMRVSVVPLGALAVTSATLLRRGRVYQVAAAAQAVLYGLGMLGLAAPRSRIAHRRSVALPAYFCLVNAAQAVALWNLARRQTVDRWEPQRGSERRP
jgi:cellulose synthase/poly-beta-1,6-N-acetylglucosamine synthase-like glycosyltransferase